MNTLRAKHFHLIEDMDISALTFAAIERVETSVKAVATVVRLWVRRSKDRRIMAQMNEHMLTDIGLSRFDIETEAAKFFWQK